MFRFASFWMRIVPGFSRGIFSPLSTCSSSARTVPSLRSSRRFSMETPLGWRVVGWLGWFDSG